MMESANANHASYSSGKKLHFTALHADVGITTDFAAPVDKKRRIDYLSYLTALDAYLGFGTRAPQIDTDGITLIQNQD